MDVVEDGNRYIRFSYDGIFEEILDKLGQMPLPPYITHTLQDRSYYNTVYAKFDGSAAAPTAGLHFTKELLKEIQDKGVGRTRASASRSSRCTSDSAPSAPSRSTTSRSITCMSSTA